VPEPAAAWHRAQGPTRSFTGSGRAARARVAHGLPNEITEVSMAQMNEKIEGLLYEALETELGGIQVYTNAVQCAVNDDLKEEWEKYLEQTKRHVEIVTNILETAGLGPGKEQPRREVGRQLGGELLEGVRRGP